MTIVLLPSRSGHFVSLSSLTALAGMSQIMLNQRGDNGHPCLVPGLGGKASNLSPPSMMPAVGFPRMAFVMVGCVRSLPTFLKDFIRKGHYFVKCLFSICWEDPFESFILLMRCTKRTDLCLPSYLCALGVNPTGSWCRSFSWVFEFGFPVLWWELCISVHQGCESIVFLLRSVLTCLWYQGDAGLLRWIWMYSFLFSFLEEFEKDWR